MKTLFTPLLVILATFSLLANANENKPDVPVKVQENAYIKVLKESYKKSSCDKKSKKKEFCIELRVRCKLPIQPAHANMPLAVITWFDADGIPQASSPSMGKCSYPGEVTVLKLSIPVRESSYKINLLPVFVNSLDTKDFSRW